MGLASPTAHQVFRYRSGKPLALKDIEQYIANEKKKEEEVIAVRLENIKLINKVFKLCAEHFRGYSFLDYIRYLIFFFFSSKFCFILTKCFGDQSQLKIE